MKYYVYILYRIDKPAKIELKDFSLLYEPYYVGKGSGNRINIHSKISSTKHKKDAITKSLLENYSFNEFSRIVKYFKNEDNAYEYEKELIEEIGLENLTNIVEGGKGGVGNMFKGKTYEEVMGKERAEKRKLNLKNSLIGKKHSKEHKIKNSKSHLEYYKDIKNRIKHSKYLSGRKMPESQSKSTSERFKNKPKSAEQKRKISEAAIGKKQSEEHKFNAAFARSKNIFIMNINNKKYLIFKQTFSKILKEYVSIKSGSIIKSYSDLDGVSINEDCSIGPHARIRPNSIIYKNSKIGNYVEIKNSSIGKGSSISHLTYIGDSKVGNKVNIGAGCITCNYDGVKKSKTIIGDNSFIGSNTSLIAPVKIGNNVKIGAGSVINKDISDNKLAIRRSKLKIY